MNKPVRLASWRWPGLLIMLVFVPIQGYSGKNTNQLAKLHESSDRR